mgnify:CR=1 FL=1
MNVIAHFNEVNIKVHVSSLGQALCVFWMGGWIHSPDPPETREPGPGWNVFACVYPVAHRFFVHFLLETSRVGIPLWRTIFEWKSVWKIPVQIYRCKQLNLWFKINLYGVTDVCFTGINKHLTVIFVDRKEDKLPHNIFKSWMKKRAANLLKR